MSDRPEKAKETRRTTTRRGPPPLAGPTGKPPNERPVRGARLVHELSGSLAAIALHLHMASKDDLPARSAEHIRDSLEAVRSARGRLTELAEILETLAKTG